MAKNRYLIGVDMGTMVVKTTIFDLDGRDVSSAHGEYPLESPHPGWAEQDQGLWWSEITKTIKEALSKANIPPEEIASVGCCGQCHGPSPISKEGKALGKCITWVDRRAHRQESWIKEHVGLDHGEQTLTAVKLLWLKENRPKIFEKTFKFMLPKDYIVYQLTGEFITDTTYASVTDMFDFEKLAWSEELLKAYGIPWEKLPEIRKPWEVIGEVTREAAEETGLKAGIPVVAGGGDYACLFYGAGFVKPGRTLDLTGTVGALLLATNRPIPIAIHRSRGIKALQIIPNIYADSAGGSQTAGAVYRWFRDEFGLLENSISEKTGLSEYQLLDLEAEKVEPGSGGVYVVPYFLGRGGPLNRYGLVFGLTLSTRREQIVRAIMEGLAYEMRRGKDEWDQRGVKCDEVRAIGGGGASRVWRQIKADILGIPYCRLNIEETGCFGVAVLAGVGVGAYRDLIRPIERMVKVVERNEPREEFRERYAKLYEIYKRLNTTLEDSGIYNDYSKTLEIIK